MHPAKVFDYIKLLKTQTSSTNMQWLAQTGKENLKEQTECWICLFVSGNKKPGR
jgi:hypothetical protein